MKKLKSYVKMIALAGLLISVGMLSACSSKGASVVIIAGSTSVQPYAEMLAERYTAQFPETEIDIQGGGSAAGIMAAETGAADIGMSSRDLNESESSLWHVEIAKDGLAIIIHPNNPIQDLTLEQIRDIYAFKTNNWNELGGPDAKIHVITREEGSGTRSAFESLVMGKEEITPRAIVQGSNGAVRQLVSSDRNSIGFISMGLVDQTVKAIYLEGIEATWDNVLNGSYSLFRPFLFVAESEPTGLAKEFVDYTLSAEGQRLLITEGLIPNQSVQGIENEAF